MSLKSSVKNKRLVDLATKQLQDSGACGDWVIDQSKKKVGFTTHVKTTLLKTEGTSGPLRIFCNIQ